MPESERHLYPLSYLTDSLAVRLGGRAAEIIVLGEASTGASNDLAGATDLATRMVREWGLSDEIGPVGYGPEGPTRDNPFAGRAYAEKTQRSIDREGARLLREAETIDGKDLAAIVGMPARNTGRPQTLAPRAVVVAARGASVILEVTLDQEGFSQRRRQSRP